MFTTSMIFVIVITFFMGLYLGGERQKRKFLIRNVQIQSERNNKSFRFNHKKENVERLYSQSIEAEKMVACEVPEYIIDTLVEEIPYILFTSTFNCNEKHWLSRPKGKILITEDGIDDENHVFDRVRLYVNNKEIQLERHEQIRIINALITVNDNAIKKR